MVKRIDKPTPTPICGNCGKKVWLTETKTSARGTWDEVVNKPCGCRFICGKVM